MILSISWSPFNTRPVHSVICGGGLKRLDLNTIWTTYSTFRIDYLTCNCTVHVNKDERFKILWKYIFGVLVIRCFGPSVFWFSVFRFSVFWYSVIWLFGVLTCIQSDWYLSWQATVTQITVIRHWGVTNMSSAIKENPCYVVLKKTRFVWRYPCKNLYDNSVAFHSIVMHVMLCVFLSRVCWLPKRGPTWLHKSSFDCALMLIFGHHHYAHVYTQLTMVNIDSFG